MALETGRSSSTQPLLSLAAMLVAAGIALPPAYAADLGGNCCADLEERVAELEATTARKGNRKVSLTISGQVHTQVMAWDDGNDSDVYITDYTAGTGVNFTGSAKINPDLTAGFLINIGFDTGARSHQVSQDDDDADDAADATIVITRAAWYLDHKRVGRLTVGRANTATHGITTINLGGTGVIADANVGYWNGGFEVGGVSWNNALGGSAVSGSGSTRGNIIHYTSPTAGGFSVQAAWGEDDIWDVALRYAGEFSGFRLAAGVGYIDNFKSNNGGEFFKDDSSLDGVNQVKVGASLLHVASGLFLSGAYVDQDNGDAADFNTTLAYIQGGIAKNWTGLGNTVLYGEYTKVTDAVATESDADVWGLGVVQHIDAAAMEVYLSYRQYSTDFATTVGETTVGVDDFNIVMGGARIRF